MRFACEAVFLRMSAGPRPQQKASKSAKAFVVLEKVRKTPTSLYQISFPVAGDKTGNKFLLDQPPHIAQPLIQQGKITLTFQVKPAVSVLISKANPQDLQQLIDCLAKIAKGEDVDVDKVKIKTTDFKPTTLRVKDLSEYQKQRQSFSEFLNVLHFEPINLRNPDRKWAICRNLTRLTLTGNPFATNFRDVDVIGKMRNLYTLEMGGCQLGEVPRDGLRKLFRALPTSIRELNIGDNRLEIFPPIFHLTGLRVLIISNNLIQYLPSRFAVFSDLQTFNVSNNRISALPYIFQRRSIQHFEISGNNMICEDLVPVPDRTMLTKVDKLEYSHPGGVDTLKTIAANAVHRRLDLMSIVRTVLPLCLRFHVDDLIYEDPAVSALELCTGCRKLRHIRWIHPVFINSRCIANTVDVVNQFINFNYLYCRDCYRPQTYDIPVDPDFFKYSI